MYVLILAHICIQIYPWIQRSRHACITRPIYTPLHIQTQNCMCIQTVSIAMYTDWTTFKVLNAHKHFCTQHIHKVTQGPQYGQCSVLINSQANPWFPAPLGWLSLPSISPLPQPHDRQLLLLPTPCLPSASHPPRGPQIPD